MDVYKTLQKIQQVWITKVTQRLATVGGIQQSIQRQLIRFFELTVQAVVTGDPDSLNPLLDDWIDARLQVEPGGRVITLTPILDQIFQVTPEVLHDQLSEREAFELLSAIFPIYTHSIVYTSQKEADLHIKKISTQLEDARVTLEQVDKSKSDFISIAAHELKTPLTLIEGYTAMLQERLRGLDEYSQVPILLKGIDNGTRRLHDIVDDMIDVSLIDNNMLALNYQPVRINHLLATIVADYKPTIHARGQSIEIKSFPGNEEITFADEERIYQALHNIIANAIKYTPDGGSINIDGRLLPGFIELIISDTGIGVNPVDHGIIFEKFGRIGTASLHSTSKTKFKGGGPGLGLPITKGIIEAHGGTIWVESDGYDEVDCPGATFHILLPRRNESPDGGITEMFRTSIGSDNFGDLYAQHLESFE